MAMAGGHKVGISETGKLGKGRGPSTKIISGCRFLITESLAEPSQLLLQHVTLWVFFYKCIVGNNEMLDIVAVLSFNSIPALKWSLFNWCSAGCTLLVGDKVILLVSSINKGRPSPLKRQMLHLVSNFTNYSIWLFLTRLCFHSCVCVWAGMHKKLLDI